MITARGGIVLAVDPAATNDLPRRFDAALRAGKCYRAGWPCTPGARALHDSGNSSTRERHPLQDAAGYLLRDTLILVSADESVTRCLRLCFALDGVG